MFPALYHAHHRRNLEDLPFWLELGAQTGGPILELGCGTGRILIPMAQAGHQAFGLENDLSMLRFLQRNIGMEARKPPFLMLADMCNFYLSLQFPLVILPCNTFSMLTDQQRKACLRCVKRHLAKGGIFAASLPNPEWLRQLPSRSLAELEDEFIHPITGNPVQVSSSWRRRKNTFNVTWIYDQLLPDGTVERLEIGAIHLLNPLKIYMAEFENAGLMVEEIYGDFDRSAYTTDSPNLILLASHEKY